MRVLGIDTATRIGSIGFIDGDQVVFDDQIKIKPGGAEKIPAVLDEAFRKSSRRLEELQLIAVGIGPGSYTGLRVGMAIAKGLAFGLGIPLVGIVTLEALAINLQQQEEIICPLLKSRKGEVYAGLYQQKVGLLKELLPPKIWEPEKLAELLRKKRKPVIFLGEGLEEYTDYFSNALENLARFGTGTENLVHGAELARLGQAEWEKNKENQLYTCLPLYLRRTEAEVRWEERSCRVDSED